MKVLVVGSGAREHAIAWKLRQSPTLGDLFVAPGNAGTAAIATNLDIKASDIDAIVAGARDHAIDLVVVGPEDPLARGLVDRLQEAGIAAFGPTKAAAQIEASKAFSRDLMDRHGIPAPVAASFDNPREARNYAEAHPGPIVVKASGLAAGKGAIVCDNTEQALAAIDAIMGNAAFGSAGDTIVIQERLSGREVSAHAFTDGTAVSPMPFACDYKRIYDGDEGPNTGGIGAYSPPGWLDEALEPYIHEQITEATIAAMAADGTPFSGTLYPGLFITPDGLRVIEYNCRLGDPEAQVLIPRLQSDLLDICLAVANGTLAECDIRWSTDAAVGVVIASGGYPGDFKTGYPIAGLDSLDDDVIVFHAGTRRDDEGRAVTSGGRVLTVVATAPSLTEARAKVYRNVQRIHFTNAYYRRDIAAPAQNARVD
ncbi:MAG TPA: phosphoribosylamine--glycine ligase [Dehalococcoidia bacterium]|nr:phosphoribosylamine--glycine ligase [Dehalococcoidia bacterium]